MKNAVFVTFLIALFLAVPSISKAQTGQELESLAREAYQQGGSETSLAGQENAFAAAAGLFKKASEEYAAEGNPEKALEMAEMAEQAEEKAQETHQQVLQETFHSVGDLVGPGFKLVVVTQPLHALDSQLEISPRAKGFSSIKFLPSIGASVGPGPHPLIASEGMITHFFMEGIYGNPLLFQQLMEHFGGEFMVGSFPPQPLPDIELKGKTSIMPGLGLAISPIKNVEAGVAVHYFKSDWSGSFPISVFPFEPESPRMEQGMLKAAAKGLLADVFVSYVFSGSVICPFVETGFRRQFVFEESSGMHVADHAIPAEIETIRGLSSAYVEGGLRFYFIRNLYLQLGIVVSRWPGGDYGIGGGASVGCSI